MPSGTLLLCKFVTEAIQIDYCTSFQLCYYNDIESTLLKFKQTNKGKHNE